MIIGKLSSSLFKRNAVREGDKMAKAYLIAKAKPDLKNQKVSLRDPYVVEGFEFYGSNFKLSE